MIIKIMIIIIIVIVIIIIIIIIIIIVYLCNGGVAIVRVRLILNAVGGRSTALSFINGNANTLHSIACYLFDSHIKDSRGLAIEDGSSVLLKAANIL